MRLLATGLRRVLVPLLTGPVLVAALLVPLLTAPAPAQASDPDWVFYTANKTRFTSPWYDGAHRIMVPFGCTAAPYYEPDERCEDDQGFHHGIDIAMNCGTKLYAGARARVVASTSLGTAYGEHPILLRNLKQGWDVVIGHTRRVFVHEGQIVKKGQLIALASDDGAPDGCHLHFEKRAVFGDLSTATGPRKLLGLVAVTPPGRNLRGSMDDSDRRVLGHFLTPDGSLRTIPSKRAKLLVVLEHLSQSFEPGRTYTETEVNAVLRPSHEDVAALRRYLVEDGFLTRENSVYWRSGGEFEV